MKKKLGQHFITNKNIINQIINIINPYYLDYLLEIGSGYGNITLPLINKGLFKHLFLIEIDNNLILFLKKNINNKKITIIHNDILKINLKALFLIYKLSKKIRIIGNIPFYISKKILFYFIKNIFFIKNINILIQKELGIKLISVPKNKLYSKISIYIQFFFTIKTNINISSRYFIPIPKVNGIFITLTPKIIFYKFTYYFNIIKIFFKIINICFKKKRKTILNSLNNIINKYKLLLKINLKLRPNNLTGNDYFYISYWIFFFNLCKKKLLIIS